MKRPVKSSAGLFVLADELRLSTGKCPALRGFTRPGRGLRTTDTEKGMWTAREMRCVELPCPYMHLTDVAAPGDAGDEDRASPADESAFSNKAGGTEVTGFQRRRLVMVSPTERDRQRRVVTRSCYDGLSDKPGFDGPEGLSSRAPHRAPAPTGGTPLETQRPGPIPHQDGRSGARRGAGDDRTCATGGPAWLHPLLAGRAPQHTDAREPDARDPDTGAGGDDDGDPCRQWRRHAQPLLALESRRIVSDA